MTPLQKLARVPLPAGPWEVCLSMDNDGDWLAMLCDDFARIVVQFTCYDGEINTRWVMELSMTLTPYRLRQAKAWAKAVEAAMKGKR